MKKIIFGASVAGKAALAYFGPNNVYAFVDNSLGKQGKIMYDKPVLSFDELKNCFMKYDIIIASRYADEIALQLKSSGIHQFEVFLNRTSYDFVHNFQKDVFSKYNSVAIYGATEFAKQICFQFWKNDIQEKLTAVVQYDDKPLGMFETTEHVYPLKRLEDLDQVECIIIADAIVENAITIKVKNSIFNSAHLINLFSRKVGPNSILIYNKYEDPWFECKDEQSHITRRLNQSNQKRAINARTSESSPSSIN